jgi:hypothetical protein
MVDPQPTLVELLVRHVLLPRELLPQIEINSIKERFGMIGMDVSHCNGGLFGMRVIFPRLGNVQ